MRLKSSTRKKLQRLAILTAPLVAAFSFAPVFLIVFGRNPAAAPLLPEGIEQRLLFGYFIITLIIYASWQINILLVDHQEKLKVTSPFRRYLASYVLIFILVILLTATIGPMRPEPVNLPDIMPIIGTIAYNTLILVLINLVLVQDQKAQLQLEKAQLEISHLKMQQEQLKQQVHPHFLFNALSNLQLLISKAPEQAKLYTTSLASFLRKSISLAEFDLHPLKEELQYLDDYLKLQQMRFPEAIDIQFDLKKVDTQKIGLPVFCLQILVENAIKHNALAADQPLQISISAEGPKTLIVSNNRLPKYQTPEGTGLGLSNLTDRFQSLKLNPPEITATEQHFSVSIEMTEL